MLTKTLPNRIKRWLLFTIRFLFSAVPTLQSLKFTEQNWKKFRTEAINNPNGIKAENTSASYPNKLIIAKVHRIEIVVNNKIRIAGMIDRNNRNTDKEIPTKEITPNSIASLLMTFFTACSTLIFESKWELSNWRESIVLCMLSLTDLF